MKDKIKSESTARQYDYYEIELREMYKSASRPQNESHFEMLMRKGSEYLNKDSVFCEIGFSAGLTLRYAMDFFKIVYGLDISPKNVGFTENELRREGYTNFRLFTCDLLVHDNQFENKFDVISFIHGLEHFKDNEYTVLLNNIRSYLKEGGIFTGALPFLNKFNMRMCPSCNHVFEIDGHVSSHDLGTLRKIFESNGFQVIHLDNYNLSYLLRRSNIPKKVFLFLKYWLARRRSGYQIEFIVRPE